MNLREDIWQLFSVSWSCLNGIFEFNASEFYERPSNRPETNRKVQEESLKDVYRSSTSFSFCLKMFLSSPRVDSIFSRENWFSPSADLSLATQELSSVTVLSRRTHSLTRTSHFLTQVSEMPLTLSYLSFSPATWMNNFIDELDWIQWI